MAKTKKYVRILKAGEPSYWYVNKIGRMFEFEREGNFTYKTREKDGSLAVIRKEDAELIVTEKRPAKVGERVLITDTEDSQEYRNGEEYEVTDVHYYSVSVKGRSLVLYNDEYEVIVNNEVKNEEADDMKIDLNAMGYDELIEHGEAVMRAIRLRSYGEGYKQGKFDADMDATYMRPQEKTAQERRDEIVEQAKADVERLRENNRRLRTFNISLEVNRKARSVEAVAKKPNSRTAFYGTAICAPDDCFNVHIGKAIALHRALGLEVPDEYLNAPNPTEVRVGDVVECRPLKDIRHVKVVADGEYIGTGLDKAAISSVAVTCRLRRIIDDSRTEVGE
ncbi:hypothetical protein [Bacillus sp. NSP9.1]|uniref:hypothetical protein n=1 Tax=Bacillus sp. NSP9.1 TaxID=1071078 RepID=UPI0003F7A505|nr:hypothetical protein [Bacillus sp. NSP9.1]QHZ45850.1 hypothetical protein M654_005725 [Bacillus sp. NSP9.1]